MFRVFYGCTDVWVIGNNGMKLHQTKTLCSHRRAQYIQIEENVHFEKTKYI